MKYIVEYSSKSTVRFYSHTLFGEVWVCEKWWLPLPLATENQFSYIKAYNTTFSKKHNIYFFFFFGVHNKYMMPFAECFE